jgi:hypothetical protein
MNTIGRPSEQRRVLRVVEALSSDVAHKPLTQHETSRDKALAQARERERRAAQASCAVCLVAGKHSGSNGGRRVTRRPTNGRAAPMNGGGRGCRKNTRIIHRRDRWLTRVSFYAIGSANGTLQRPPQLLWYTRATPTRYPALTYSFSNLRRLRKGRCVSLRSRPQASSGRTKQPSTIRVRDAGYNGSDVFKQLNCKDRERCNLKQSSRKHARTRFTLYLADRNTWAKCVVSVAVIDYPHL